jgi:histidine transport system permease protein/arginine/ornithine transport system permease protein
MAAAFVIYLVLTGISDLLLRAVDRHYSRGCDCHGSFLS